MNRLAANTDKTLDHWEAIARACRVERHSDLVARLMEDHGLSHGDAKTVALKARRFGASLVPDVAPAARIFAGTKGARRPVDEAARPVDRLHAGGLAKGSNTPWMKGLAASTGKTLDQWKAIAHATGVERHSDLVARLMEDHGLSHGDAKTVALKARKFDASLVPDVDPAARIFAGPKAAMRPVYEKVVALIRQLGGDVVVAHRLVYTSARRGMPFARVQPSGDACVDLGLNLAGVAPGGRLEASGGVNCMFSHCVRLSSDADVDGEVRAWLREAYDRAGPVPAPRPSEKLDCVP